MRRPCSFSRTRSRAPDTSRRRARTTCARSPGPPRSSAKASWARPSITPVRLRTTGRAIPAVALLADAPLKAVDDERASSFRARRQARGLQRLDPDDAVDGRIVVTNVPRAGTFKGLVTIYARGYHSRRRKYELTVVISERPVATDRVQVEPAPIKIDGRLGQEVTFSTLVFLGTFVERSGGNRRRTPARPRPGKPRNERPAETGEDARQSTARTLQAGGHRFDPGTLHLRRPRSGGVFGFQDGNTVSAVLAKCSQREREMVRVCDHDADEGSRARASTPWSWLALADQSKLGVRQPDGPVVRRLERHRGAVRSAEEYPRAPLRFVLRDLVAALDTIGVSSPSHSTSTASARIPSGLTVQPRRVDSPSRTRSSAR